MSHDPSSDDSTDDAPADEPPANDPLEESPSGGSSEMADTRDARLGPLDDTDAVQRALLWAGVGLLALLSAVATLRVYTNASAAIAQFVAPDFQPLFEATFNLAVLLFAIAGIGLLLRRLDASA